mgnify:CR=1 FL=1
MYDREQKLLRGLEGKILRKDALSIAAARFVIFAPKTRGRDHVGWRTTV